MLGWAATCYERAALSVSMAYSRNRCCDRCLRIDDGVRDGDLLRLGPSALRDGHLEHAAGIVGADAIMLGSLGQGEAALEAPEDRLAGVMNESGSYPGQPWLWLYTLWYQLPGFRSSANVDLIAIYLTGAATVLLLAVPFVPGLRDIPRLVPVHRMVWRDWHRREADGPAGSDRERQAPEPASLGQHDPPVR